MRKLALLLVVIPALGLAQQAAQPPPPPAKKPPTNQNQVYKWVDEDGVVHYTDKPPADGAQPAKLKPLQTYKGGTNPKLGNFERSGAAGGKPAAAGNVQIDIVTPAGDETFRGAERVVPVAVMVTPQLQPGQKLIYLLDGTPASTPVADTSFALTGVERGAHTVSVTLVDESGNQLGASTAVTFHMKPPTLDRSPPATPPSTTPPPPKPKPKP